MKLPTWAIITIIVLLGCIPLSWWLGRRSGIDLGAKTGIWHHNLNTISYILGSRALEEQGDLVKARKAIDNALYLNASSLDMHQDSILLTEENSSTGEGALIHVAEYYWKHPETYDIDANLTLAPPNNSTKNKFSDLIKPFLGKSVLEIANDYHNRTRSILLRHKPSSMD